MCCQCERGVGSSAVVAVLVGYSTSRQCAILAIFYIFILTGQEAGKERQIVKLFFFSPNLFFLFVWRGASRDC